MSTARRRMSKAKQKELRSRLIAGERMESPRDIIRLFPGMGERGTVWAGGLQPTTEELAEFVVCYFNGTDVEDSALALLNAYPQGLGRGLLGLVHAVCMTYPVGLPTRVEERRFELEEIPGTRPRLLEHRNTELAVKELRAKRKHFREAVSWLCGIGRPSRSAAESEDLVIVPAKERRAGMEPAVEKVLPLLRAVPAEPPTPEEVKFMRYFQIHGLNHIQEQVVRAGNSLVLGKTPRHIIDLFCSFLIETAGHGTDLMPVKLCHHCGMLFSCASLTGRAREKKQFCSPRCQNAGYWAERRTDYRYVERLGDYDDGKLRDRLEEPKVQHRLKSIEERWSDWSGILELIRRLRKRASKRSGSKA